MDKKSAKQLGRDAMVMLQLGRTLLYGEVMKQTASGPRVRLIGVVTWDQIDHMHIPNKTLVKEFRDQLDDDAARRIGKNVGGMPFEKLLIARVPQPGEKDQRLEIREYRRRKGGRVQVKESRE